MPWPKGFKAPQRKPELDRLTPAGRERYCRSCERWHAITRFSPSKDCHFGRGYLCTTCHSKRRELNRMRKEERDALAAKLKQLDAGLLELRKAVTKAERERRAG